MVRLPVVLSSVMVSLWLAAQPLQVTAPQPISVTRMGVTSGNAFLPMVASNGHSFLMAWVDDRGALQSLGSGNQSGTSMLMRVDADGGLLDEFPIAIPFAPVGIVWTGSEWIAGGVGTLARVSAEGTVLELRPIGATDFLARGLAWTGNALVVVGSITKGPSDYTGTGGVRALTFDAQLHVVADKQLTNISAEVFGTAGDGQSAITLWRFGRYVSPGNALHVASFGPDGLVQQIWGHYISGLPEHPYTYTLAIGATGKGYVVLYQGGSSTDYKATWIEHDLSSRPIEVGYGLHGGARSLAWDGTSLTYYSTDFEGHLMATRFSEDGFLVSPPRVVGMLGSRFPELGAAGVTGKTVVAYGNWQTAAELRFRVLAPPAYADSPERSPAGASALPQDFPAAVSTPSQSLVVWRERTSRTEWGIHATRLDRNATVLDPESLVLAASSCDKIRPAVATDGQDFLAAWHDKDGIAIASIRADGTFTKRPSLRPRYGATCSEALLQLVSNGTDYLLLWVEKVPKSADVWDLFALRLRADGSVIDFQPLAVGKLTGSYPISLSFFATSNRQDYLVAWDGAAVRVSSDGALLDTSAKILLGEGWVGHLWWNGTTYVAEMNSWDGYRYLRIGSDGSGGRSPVGPQAELVPFPPGPAGVRWSRPASRTCDSSGCWAASTTRHPDGHDTLTAIRYDDDGTRITVRAHEVANVSFTSMADLIPVPAGVVNAGRPAILYLPQRMEQPFLGVHRLMIAPFAVPRGRAARHP